MRLSAIVMSFALVSTTIAGFAAAPPAAAVVTCPTVDPSTHAVTPAPSSGVDWSGCSLAGADLSNQDLSSANLNGTNLSNANIDSANFANATLIGANLSHANLTNATFQDTTLNGANLSNAIARNIYLAAADLNSANLSNVDFSGSSNLIYADFSMANLEGVSFVNALLDSADFSGANLTDSDMTNSDLSGATMATAFVTCSESGSLGTNVTRSPAGGLPTGWTLIGGALSVPIVVCPIPSTPDFTLWMKSTARESASDECPDGYTGSWAMWPNAGTGGYVCNRFVFAYGS